MLRVLRDFGEISWFIRGAIFSLTVFAAVGEITQIERLEYLAAAHAILSGWDAFAAYLGYHFGQWFGLPDIDHYTVNAFVFATSFGLPVAFGIYRFLTQDDRPGTVGWKVTGVIVGALFIWSSTLIFYELSTGELSLSDLLAADVIKGTLMMLAIAFFGVGVMVGYRFGIAFVIAFLLLTEVLYHLNTPGFTGWVEQLPDSLQSFDPRQ